MSVLDSVKQVDSGVYFSKREQLLQGLSNLDQKIHLLTQRYKEQVILLPIKQSQQSNDECLMERIKFLEEENTRLHQEKNEILSRNAKVNTENDTPKEKGYEELKKILEEKDKEIKELREKNAKLELDLSKKNKALRLFLQNSTDGAVTDRYKDIRTKSNPNRKSVDSVLQKVQPPKNLRVTVFKNNQESDGRYNMSFGTLRGACTCVDCVCTQYVSENNGKCENCDHFPALHIAMGKADLTEFEEDNNNKIIKENKETVEKGDQEKIEIDRNKLKETEESDVETSDQMEDEQPNNSLPHDKRRKLVPKHIPNRDIKAETQSEIRSHLDADWLISFNDITFITKMGRGVSSTVWKGTLRDEVVAIKVLRLEQKMQDLRDFKEELFIMSRLRSPNIVHFYGATLEPKLCIVMELCVNGSLYHYLSKLQSEVTWERVRKWSMQVSRGINTLHLWKPPLVHRDLKTLNLLLDREYCIKVCDFGLSRYTQGEQCDDTTLQKLRGTYAYTAPEMYYSKNYTAKSDVYSIGVVIWELVVRFIKGKHFKPYSEYSDIKYDYQIIFQVAQNQRRPTIPPECPSKMKEIIEKCWSQNPVDRPTAAELVQLLKNVKSSKKKSTKFSSSPTKTSK